MLLAGCKAELLDTANIAVHDGFCLPEAKGQLASNERLFDT
jgi:hypothetical protein